MDWPSKLLLTWPIWIAWSAAITLLVRIIVASLFKQFMAADRAYLAAYLTFPALLVLGATVVGLTGMPMYGFDGENWAHWLGYATLYLSPIGLPLVLGIPLVLIADIVRRPWRHAAS